MIVYWTLIGNTRKLVHKLEVNSLELTWDNCLELKLEEPFLLVTPTYAKESTDLVWDFLEDEQNRAFCRGIIGTGNRNFASLFCYTARDLSEEYGVPLVHSVEFQGSSYDVKRIKEELERIG